MIHVYSCFKTRALTRVRNCCVTLYFGEESPTYPRIPKMLQFSLRSWHAERITFDIYGKYIDNMHKVRAGSLYRKYSYTYRWKTNENYVQYISRYGDIMRSCVCIMYTVLYSSALSIISNSEYKYVIPGTHDTHTRMQICYKQENGRSE